MKLEATPDGCTNARQFLNDRSLCPGGDYAPGARKYVPREINTRSLRDWNLIWSGPKKQTYH